MHDNARLLVIELVVPDELEPTDEHQGMASGDLTMLLATGCGQVDMVLVTTGRSSWSLINGLLAVVVNVGLDVLLIPRYGIIGAAIGWSAAIILTNLTPLAQVAATLRLHPFGRGTFISAALSALSFGVLPLAARGLSGHGAVPSLTAIACGCAVMAAGMWRFRADLNLAAMPGAAQLTAARRRHKKRLGEHPARHAKSTRLNLTEKLSRIRELVNIQQGEG